jgi:hypothetical protein
LYPYGVTLFMDLVAMYKYFSDESSFCCAESTADITNLSMRIISTVLMVRREQMLMIIVYFTTLHQIQRLCPSMRINRTILMVTLDSVLTPLFRVVSVSRV